MQLNAYDDNVALLLNAVVIQASRDYRAAVGNDSSRNGKNKLEPENKTPEDVFLRGFKTHLNERSSFI